MIKRHIFIRTAILSLLLSLLTATAESEEDFVVSRVQVAHAFDQAGRPVSAEQIQFLSSVHTRQPNAALKLIGFADWQDGLLKAEIGCVDHTTCLPFYVLVQDAAIPALVHGTRTELGAPARSLKNYDVHVGETAVLTFEDSESRITMHVICVQNGDRGQKIKVASRDRKRFYEAEVIEPGFLRGIL